MNSIKTTPIDVADLIDYYNAHHPTFKTCFNDALQQNGPLTVVYKSDNQQYKPKISTYELVYFFIEDQVKKNPASNFILDEVPILQEGENSLLLTIHNVIKIRLKFNQLYI